jgi:hypothetical protein
MPLFVRAISIAERCVHGQCGLADLDHFGMPDIERPTAGHLNPKRPKRLGRDEIHNFPHIHHGVDLNSNDLPVKSFWGGRSPRFIISDPMPSGEPAGPTTHIAKLPARDHMPAGPGRPLSVAQV